MANKVELKSIGSLFSGKDHFYIPSYQRGYRWRRKQAEELMSDLYSFTQNPGGDFYCLQPVIVKPILPGDPRRREALGDLADSTDHNLWELVDGQQRLTSIFIMLKALEVVTNSDIEEDYEIELYSLHYESRPDFLKGIENVDRNLPELTAATDIDAAHANSVFRIMQDWFGSRGKYLSCLYKGGRGDKKKNIAADLLRLITAETDKNTVKVIWYEIEPTAETDTVKEFINVNNGKIPLLDSELVKALFLQRRNNNDAVNEEIQTERALMWEMMENRLQANDFWSFISPDDNKTEDRMGLLLAMIYLSEQKDMKEMEKGDVFRYFYDAFEGKQGEDLTKALSEKWESVLDAYHAIEDWYESPVLYNYVGYLMGTGECSISEIFNAYKASLGSVGDMESEEDAPDDAHREDEDSRSLDFREWLIGRIKDSLKNVEVVLEEVENQNVKPRINLQYSNKTRKLIRNLFRFLNIHILTGQFEAIVKNSDEFINDAGVFRFPFHLYKDQEWDIEHIDSQTSNPLTSTKDKIHWVVGALLDTLPALSPEARSSLQNILMQIDSDSDFKPDWAVLEDKIGSDLYADITHGNWDNAIRMIEAHEETDMENIHDIGNLTLLDAATNRSYKNALFCTKRKYVIEALTKGHYILPATQVVFMKFFDSDTLSVSSRIKWLNTDKEKHRDFIYTNLKNFLPDAR